MTDDLVKRLLRLADALGGGETTYHDEEIQWIREAASEIEHLRTNKHFEIANCVIKGREGDDFITRALQGEPLRIIGYTIVPNEECKELHQTISAGWGLAARIARLETALAVLSTGDGTHDIGEITVIISDARAALADEPGEEP